jgi:hypothetical protein
VLNTNLVISFSFSLVKSIAEISGRYSEKFPFACLTNAFLSARNNTRLTQLFLKSISVKAAAVLVLPLPVAITNNALRLLPQIPFSLSVTNASATRCMASI